jgi:hypothetical protein
MDMTSVWKWFELALILIITSLPSTKTQTVKTIDGISSNFTVFMMWWSPTICIIIINKHNKI